MKKVLEGEASDLEFGLFSARALFPAGRLLKETRYWQDAETDLSISPHFLAKGGYFSHGLPRDSVLIILVVRELTLR